MKHTTGLKGGREEYVHVKACDTCSNHCEYLKCAFGIDTGV